MAILNSNELPQLYYSYNYFVIKWTAQINGMQPPSGDSAFCVQVCVHLCVCFKIRTLQIYLI